GTASSRGTWRTRPSRPRHADGERCPAHPRGGRTTSGQLGDMLPGTAIPTGRAPDRAVARSLSSPSLLASLPREGVRGVRVRTVSRNLQPLHKLFKPLSDIET